MGYETVNGKEVRIFGRAGKKNYSYGYATASITHTPLGYGIILATRRKMATAQPKIYKTKGAAIKAAKKMVANRG